jgi:hypothetical protein
MPQLMRFALSEMSSMDFGGSVPRLGWMHVGHMHRR